MLPSIQCPPNNQRGRPRPRIRKSISHSRRQTQLKLQRRKKKTQSVWPLESLSPKELVLHVNSRKLAAAEASVIIANNNAKLNNTPHHLILPQLQQKKTAAPLPSPNGLWSAALSLDLPGFITNVKSSRSGPKPYSAKKKRPEPALVEPDPAPAPPRKD